MINQPPLNPIAELLGYQHPIFEWPVKGKCYGWSHFEKIEITIPSQGNTEGKPYTAKGILDRTTGAVYRDGEEFTADYLIVKCFLSNCVLAIHLIGTVVFNVLRVVPLIFYCTISIFTRYFTEKKANSSISFKAIFIDQMKILGVELLRSIINIIRAPYYTLAIFFSQLYGLVDPWNGRKLTALFEEAWNHHIPVNQSFWMIRRMPEFKFKLIGENSLYIPACFQPVAFIENGRVFNATHLQKDDRTILLQKPTGCFCVHLLTSNFT